MTVLYVEVYVGKCQFLFVPPMVDTTIASHVGAQIGHDLKIAEEPARLLKLFFL